MSLPSIIARLEKALPGWNLPHPLRRSVLDPETSGLEYWSYAMDDTRAAAIIVAEVKEWLIGKKLIVQTSRNWESYNKAHWYAIVRGYVGSDDDAWVDGEANAPTEIEALAAACEAMKN